VRAEVTSVFSFLRALLITPIVPPTPIKSLTIRGRSSISLQNPIPNSVGPFTSTTKRSFPSSQVPR